MDARLNLFGSTVGAKALRHLNAAGQALTDSGLPPTTQELVKIRASQLNGCGFCLDMHTKEASAAGESALRLNLVAAWREATVFTEAERAALELTEQGTRLADARCRQRTGGRPHRRPSPPRRRRAGRLRPRARPDGHRGGQRAVHDADHEHAARAIQPGLDRRPGVDLSRSPVVLPLAHEQQRR